MHFSIQRPISLGAASTILEVERLIARGDREGLSRALRRPKDAGRIATILRDVAPFSGYTTRGRAGSVVSHHTALFAIPVVVPLGQELPPSKELVSAYREVDRNVGRLFGVGHVTHLVAWSVGYQTLTALDPFEVREFLDDLAVGKKVEFTVPAPGTGDSVPSHFENIPDLRFIVGAVATIGNQPEFPEEHDLNLTAAVRHAVSSSDSDPVACGGVARFADALVDGLQLWVDAMFAREHSFKWSLDLESVSAAVLNVSACIGGDRSEMQCEIPLNLAQIGLDGAERLARYLHALVPLTNLDSMLS